MFCFLSFPLKPTCCLAILVRTKRFAISQPINRTRIFPTSSTWLNPRQFCLVQWSGIGTSTKFCSHLGEAGLFRRRGLRYPETGTARLRAASDTYLYLSFKISDLAAPSYAQIEVRPSGVKPFLLHHLWVTPSTEFLSHTGQTWGKHNLAAFRQEAQKYVPVLPQPAHFLGKRKSRILTDLL